MENSRYLRSFAQGLTGLSLLTLVKISCAADVTAATQSYTPPVSSGTLLQQYGNLLAPDATTSMQTPHKDDGYKPSPSGQDRTVHFLVKHIELSESLPERAEQHARIIFARVEGRRISMQDLQRVRAALNEVLLREVDVLTYARLPPQDISNGTVRFEIQHGRIGKVALNNHSLLSDHVIEQYLPNNDPGAGARDLATLAQANRRLSLLPGVSQAAVSLEPGAAPGTADVIVNATAAPRFEGALVANNGGSPSSGTLMSGGQLTWNSPFGIGDQMTGAAFYAPGQGASGSGGHTSYGSLSYDMPLGYRGIRGGMQYSRVGYQQGGPEELRSVFDGHGTAQTVRGYLTAPWVERGDANVTVGASLENKALKDWFFGVDSRRNVTAGALSIFGSKQDQWDGRPNVMRFDAELTAGRAQVQSIGINDDATGNFTHSLIGRHFFKFNVSGEYQQMVRRGLVFSLKGSMQTASKHLDPSEQMSLGGMQAVRGYDSSLSTVDQGALLSTVLTQDLTPMPGVSISAFYDVGRGQISRSDIAPGGCGCAIPGNLMTVQSAGVGLNYQFRKFSAGVSYARRIGVLPEGQFQPQRGQAWVNAKLAF